MTNGKMRYRTFAVALVLMLLMNSIPLFANAAGEGTYAYLKMALSTRTGPGTWYDEAGTYFQKVYNSTTVRVLSKAWDDRNSIWWVQVEFYRNNTPYRAYTGLKRVDVDIEYIPEESIQGTSTTTRSATGYWGPGREYDASKYDIPANITVSVLDVENNYAQIEFYDARTADRDYARKRAWIKTDYLTGKWSDSKSSYSLSGDGSSWQNAYRVFIESGNYENYLRIGNAEYSELFYNRDTQWDAYTTFDMNLDGVPELLIRTEYAIEQVDVFTFDNGNMKWLGTMEGDNFFQTIISYDGAGIRGKVYTFMGGPVMEISEYRLSNSGLIKRVVALTRVDSEGQETIGIYMYVEDPVLQSLLYGTAVSGYDQGERLRFISRNDLQSETAWNDVFSMRRY